MIDPHPIVLVAMGGHAFMLQGERHHRGSRAQRRTNRGAAHDAHRPRLQPLSSRTATGRRWARYCCSTRWPGKVPALPLDVLVAMTEGSLGYFLQQALLNQLRTRSALRYVVTVVTQVLVDENDPASRIPSKPIGPS